MVDLSAKLAQESDAALDRRRLNAARVAREHVGTARGDEAERLLALLDVEFDRRHLPGMIEEFLRAFPEGFLDPQHLEQERNFKLDASRYCKTELTPEAFAAVQAGGPTEDLLGRVRKLVQMTTMIQGGFEKPKLFDAINDPAHTRNFLAALGDLLHGPGDAADRLDRFSGVLADLGLRKWTYATYFLFLSDPMRCMYVKPDGLRRALEITRYPLEYNHVPSATLYRDVLKFAGWLKDKLEQQGNAALRPRDMIDVQSFIWHMAPTGKHAKS